MKINIRKIAKDLNLAVSTVSKALHDSYEISTETKKRVLTYAEKLDFVPNLYASSLKQKKSKNIAVVLPEVADSFFSSAINGIESVAQTKGYHVIVYLTHEDLNKQESILKNFRGGRVDGILISVCCGAAEKHEKMQVHTKDFPVVFFDRACRNIEASRVITDDFDSAYTATNHLISRGCEKISFLAPDEYLEIIEMRRRGYEAALRDANISLRKDHIVRCSNNEKETLHRLHKLLSKKTRPDGIVGSVEKLATLTYSVCHELNLKIARDIKILAFSSLPIASILNPPLTTITQPAFEMGKTAANLLFTILEKGKPLNQSIVLPSILIERASTKA
jgi:LacI family transcriptional regulator